jgi:hypothetical protein
LFPKHNLLGEVNLKRKESILNINPPPQSRAIKTPSVISEADVVSQEQGKLKSSFNQDSPE